jgi:hypothetical protein
MNFLITNPNAEAKSELSLNWEPIIILGIIDKDKDKDKDKDMSLACIS